MTENIMPYDLKYYQDNKFERYIEEVRYKRIKRVAKKVKHNKILDIGPGALTYYNSIDGWDDYTIVEPNDEFINFHSDNIEVISEYFESVKFERKFDFIICSGVLQLINNLNIFFTRLLDVCDEHTIVYLSTSNADSLHRLLGREMGILESRYSQSLSDRMYDHHHTFTMESLSRILKVSGFTALSMSTYLLKPFSDKQLIKIVDPQIVLGLENLITLFPNNGCEIEVILEKAK